MIDFDFIEQLEGNVCEGYVPDPENSQSGVTIACGFDLGQRDDEEIDRVFSCELASKLRPYAGLKKRKAQYEIDKKPLTISQAQAVEINQYAKKDETEKLLTRWRTSQSKRAFTELAPQCQTVIASVAYQYGNLSTETPNFWRQVTQGRWQEALANLRDFKDNYATRRNKEADLLQSWLETVEQ